MHISHWRFPLGAAVFGSDMMDDMMIAKERFFAPYVSIVVLLYFESSFVQCEVDAYLTFAFSTWLGSILKFKTDLRLLNTPTILVTVWQQGSVPARGRQL